MNEVTELPRPGVTCRAQLARFLLHNYLDTMARVVLLSNSCESTQNIESTHVCGGKKKKIEKEQCDNNMRKKIEVLERYFPFYFFFFSSASSLK